MAIIRNRRFNSKPYILLPIFTFIHTFRSTDRSIFICCLHFQHFDSTAPILIKEEPEDCGVRSIHEVPSVSDLSDPENSLGKYIQFSYFILVRLNLFNHNMSNLLSEFS